MSSPVHQPVVVLSRRKPHLIFILVLSILTGVSIFLGEVDPDFPVWLQRVWGAACSISGAVTLVAHLQGWDRERGMYAERGGLIIQCAAIVAYILALPLYLKLDTELVIAYITAACWVGANMWEVKLISADLGMIGAARKLRGRVVNASDN